MRGLSFERRFKGMIRRSTGVSFAATLMLLSSCLPIGEPPRVGSEAPDFELATLDGEMVSLSDSRGEVVLLNLWATWCVPCRMETPYLQSMYEQHQDQGFKVVGVSVDVAAQKEAVRAFTTEFSVSYDVLHDPEGQTLSLYSVIGLPASFLIDRDGVVQFIRVGPILEGDPDFIRVLDEILTDE